jgi:hypothetical protein
MSSTTILASAILPPLSSHVPFTGGKLPKESAVALWRNAFTIHKPFHVAAARGSEFDHLL